MQIVLEDAECGGGVQFGLDASGGQDGGQVVVEGDRTTAQQFQGLTLRLRQAFPCCQLRLQRRQEILGVLWNHGP